MNLTRLSAQFRQPLRFLYVGVINTLLGLSIIYAGMAWLSLGHEASNAIGYTCALVVSFFLNKAWTFEYQRHVSVAGARFLVIIAIAYTANLATVTALIDIAGANPYLSQAIGIAPYTVFTYLGSKFFAFR